MKFLTVPLITVAAISLVCIDFVGFRWPHAQHENAKLELSPPQPERQQRDHQTGVRSIPDENLPDDTPTSTEAPH